MQDNENLINVAQIIAQKLELNPEDVMAAQRVGYQKPGEKRPRPVLVTLKSKSARDKWIQQRKTKITNKSIYGGQSDQQIYINEDLIKPLRQLFWEAKSRLQPHFTYIWIQNSKILVRKNSEDRKIHNIRSEGDIERLKKEVKVDSDGHS